MGLLLLQKRASPRAARGGDKRVVPSPAPHRPPSRAQTRGDLGRSPSHQSGAVRGNPGPRSPGRVRGSAAEGRGSSPFIQGVLGPIFLKTLGVDGECGSRPLVRTPQPNSDPLKRPLPPESSPCPASLPGTLRVGPPQSCGGHHRGTPELEPGWSLRAKPRPFAREARSVPGDSRRWPLAGRVKGRPCASVREGVPSPAPGSGMTPSPGGTGPLHGPALQDTLCPRAQGRQHQC